MNFTKYIECAIPPATSNLIVLFSPTKEVSLLLDEITRHVDKTTNIILVDTTTPPLFSLKPPAYEKYHNYIIELNSRISVETWTDACPSFRFDRITIAEHSDAALPWHLHISMCINKIYLSSKYISIIPQRVLQ